MRVLVYKRTHSGDPDDQGRFGCHDCMGQVRDRDYDAVIGVGGIGAEARRNGVAEKVNWIGIGPHRQESADCRGAVVIFDHFLYYGTEGPLFRELAPVLAERVYRRNLRSPMNFTADEMAEINRMLALAQSASASPALSTRAALTQRRCHPKAVPRRRSTHC